MNENSAGVRPETLALDILIKQTIEQGHRCSASRLFTDTKVASFPAMVIHDSVLEPVDKLVWMAIRLQVYEGKGDDIFPTFNSLAKTVNVSSRSTVSRAINILRLTRWLTLYSNHTRDSDVLRGEQSNIYILHDNSMPLIDTIYLDSSYQSFLRESIEHHHSRVKNIAQGLLGEVDGNMNNQEQVIENSLQETEQIKKKILPRYFSYSGKIMNELRSQPDIGCPENTAQNLEEADNRVQNLSAQKLNPQNLKAVSKKRSLIYPRRLSEEQRKVADRLLNPFSVNEQQRLLDEMEGRIRAEQQGMAPVYDELSFLSTLCKALKKGTFKYNLGIKVKNERRARKRAEKRKNLESGEQSNSPKMEELRKEIIAGGGPLADIRKILRMPKPSRLEV